MIIFNISNKYIGVLTLQENTPSQQTRIIEAYNNGYQHNRGKGITKWIL